MALIQDYNKLYEQSSDIKKIIVNGNIVWPVADPLSPDYSGPFYVENITDTDSRLVWQQVDGGLERIHVYKSTNKTSWQDAGTTETDNYITIPARQRVYLRADTTRWATPDASCRTKQYGSNGCFKVGGNILSLLYGSLFNGQKVLRQQNGHDFRAFFAHNANIVDASELLLSDDAYDSSYLAMFHNCINLTNAPKRIGLSLGISCFENMFWGCTSLTTSPVLPASTLVSGCYWTMFNGCTSLNEIRCYATSGFNSYQCLANWTNNVSATGTFYKIKGITWPTSTSGIPSGWTIVEV